MHKKAEWTMVTARLMAFNQKPGDGKIMLKSQLCYSIWNLG